MHVAWDTSPRDGSKNIDSVWQLQEGVTVAFYSNEFEAMSTPFFFI